MAQKPFSLLAERRHVNRPELPPDLVKFYTQYEGIGLESSPDHVVRICRLNEVRQIDWKALWFGQIGEVPDGWDHFFALRIGSGMFGEETVYILDAPVCPPKSILAIGSNLICPEGGGDGPFVLESSLVLAASFSDWLAHLERWGWEEPIIAGPGELPLPLHRELGRYYLTLNPRLIWGDP